MSKFYLFAVILWYGMGVLLPFALCRYTAFYMPVSRWVVLCDRVWRMAGGRPHRFPHNNFSSVYRIFTKLDHMIALWKGKNPIYFGVIRSKVKVTVTINIIFYRLIIYIDVHILWCTHFLYHNNLSSIRLIFLTLF